MAAVVVIYDAVRTVTCGRVAAVLANVSRGCYGRWKRAESAEDDSAWCIRNVDRDLCHCNVHEVLKVHYVCVYGAVRDAHGDDDWDEKVHEL